MSEKRKPASPYETHLDKNPANYTPLSPLTFLARSAAVYPDHVAVIHGSLRRTWRQMFARSRRLAAALAGRGIGRDDTVAVIAANSPEMIELHHGVPAAGAVLNAINTRLDAAAVAFMLDHGEAKLLVADTEFSPMVKEALARLGRPIPVIDIADPFAEIPAGAGERLGGKDYEALLDEGDEDFPWAMPDDEWRAIALNYTSGTTGNPKGVVYHHRGAYLNALGNVLAGDIPHHSVYLWTLPMFHCNGWCFPWTNAAIATTNVCLRRVAAAGIYAAIAGHKVTHFCGAPIVLNMLINASEAERRPFDHAVHVMTAAAPPPGKTLQAMKEMGFRVTHLYGLTETYGPATVCSWPPEWDALPIEEQTARKSRQGVRYHVLEGLAVMDPATMAPVPADGRTMGEIMFRGNVVHKGYLKNAKATDECFAGGWFHSGDLAVMHADGYLKIQDRSKDIIISGGENISSIEVEDALYRHPAVLAAAVVARPDEKWGETPCAFVEIKAGAGVTADDLIAHCRTLIARYKCPSAVVFGELPKTSTGKIQKFRLRERAKAL